MTRRRKLLGALIVVAIGWGALFYSARAVLVWQWTDADDHRLTCRYLAANTVIVRTHLYTASGVIGRASCPRVVRLDR